VQFFCGTFVRTALAAPLFDPLQQNTRRFVVRVLRHKLAPECFGEDTLVEVINQLPGTRSLRGEEINPPKGRVNQTNNFVLLGGGRDWDRNFFDPEGNLVPGDVMLAQKIALETDERAAIDVAVKYLTLRVRRVTCGGLSCLVY
jgi:hypothetical protein